MFLLLSLAICYIANYNINTKILHLPFTVFNVIVHLSNLHFQTLRLSFPKFYLPIYLLVFVLPFLTGAGVLFLNTIKFFKNIALQFTGRFTNSTSFNKEIYQRWLSVSFAFVLVTIAFSLTEQHLLTQGNTPGVMYLQFNTVDSLVEYDNIYSDSEGIIKIRKWDGPVNDEGFAATFSYNNAAIDSIRKTGKKVVMVVGDSFTQGFSATSADSSFTSLMCNDSVVALNFGVGTTDPKQYEAIVKKYLPIINPNAVIIALCLDNDFLMYNRQLTPHQPIYFNTNAGGLEAQKPLFMGFAAGEKFKNAQEAYNYYAETFTLKQTTNPVKKAMGKLCVTTKVWQLFFIISNLRNMGKFIPCEKCAYNNLTLVIAACKLSGTKLFITGIPSMEAVALTGGVPESLRKQYPLLYDLEVAIPQGLNAGDYNTKDKHFDNSGHAKYAHFLNGLLSQ